MGKEDKEKLNSFLAGIIDAASAIIIYTSTSGEIILANEKFRLTIDKTENQLLGRSFFDVLPRQQMLKAVIEDSLHYKRINDFQGALTDSLGTEKFISWSITPVSDDSGMPQGLLLIGNDITSLQERQEALISIDQTVKNIFSSIKDYAVYVINTDGNITYCGMGFEDMFGYKKDEVIFKNIRVFHENDEIADKIAVILKELEVNARYEIETYFTKKDGRVFPVSVTISSFFDGEGKKIGYVFMAKDITERKKLEYQIFQAEKLAAIGQLAAGMAHEINNPIFVISGRAEMLLANESIDKGLRVELEIINAQADRIRKLVDRFLSFARRSPSELDLLDINEVIEGVIPFLSYHKLPTAKIDIVRQFAAGIPSIRADRHQLQEVFVNFLLNACQAMPDGGELTIKTKTSGDKFIEVAISDTGCGILPQNLKNIFMPFFTTKKNGTGLGLSICYNIIKNHNGTIDIESSPKSGTTFFIKLPVS